MGFHVLQALFSVSASFKQHLILAGVQPALCSALCSRATKVDFLCLYLLPYANSPAPEARLKQIKYLENQSTLNSVLGEIKSRQYRESA